MGFVLGGCSGYGDEGRSCRREESKEEESEFGV